MQYLSKRFTTNLLKLILFEHFYNEQDSHSYPKVLQKAAEHINACAQRKCHFLLFFCFLLSSTVISKKNCLSIITAIYSTKLMIITAGALQKLCIFIASNSLWSIKLFTELPGCCPLCRTRFLLYTCSNSKARSQTRIVQQLSLVLATFVQVLNLATILLQCMLVQLEVLVVWYEFYVLLWRRGEGITGRCQCGSGMRLMLNMFS